MALGFSVVAAVIENCLAARLLGKWRAASKGTASDRRPVVGLRREPHTNALMGTVRNTHVLRCREKQGDY